MTAGGVFAHHSRGNDAHFPTQKHETRLGRDKKLIALPEGCHPIVVVFIKIYTDTQKNDSQPLYFL